MRRVLQYDRIAHRYHVTPEEVNSYLANIRERVVLVAADPPDSPIVEADPSDDKFLVCAVEGKADCIVSGDRHLLRLGSFQGIPVVPPTTLLAFLNSEPTDDNGLRLAD